VYRLGHTAYIYAYRIERKAGGGRHDPREILQSDRRVAQEETLVASRAVSKEGRMNRAGYAMGTASPLVLGIVLAMGIAAAHAVPFVRAANDVRASTGQFPPLQAAYRHCWAHNGRRHCTAHSPRRAYGPSKESYSAYYEHIPEKLPFGSQRWWDEMVRENRGGNGGDGGGRN
jgi:hypothetical protein